MVTTAAITAMVTTAAITAIATTAAITAIATTVAIVEDMGTAVTEPDRMPIRATTATARAITRATRIIGRTAITGTRDTATGLPVGSVTALNGVQA